MNKMLRFALMAVTAVSFSLPTWSVAEAATVALLPVINNVVDREDIASIYFDRAVEATKIAGVEIVDDQRLDKAISKYTKPGVMPDKTAMEAIASEGSVDYVIAMQVDELSREDLLSNNTTDYFINIKVNGLTAYYDATKGKFKADKMMDDETMDASMGARYDVQGELFANNVTRFVKRVLGVKKVTIEKQRISKRGIRGNAR